MLEHFEFLGHPIELKRRAYQKRLGVTVYPNGKIRVSCNKTTTQSQIVHFLSSQRAWIQSALDEVRKLQEKYPAKSFREGEWYPYLGREYQLRLKFSQPWGLRFSEDQIQCGLPFDRSQWNEARCARTYEVFKKGYRQAADRILRSRVQVYAEKMGVQPQSVTIRGQKSIWGSCSPENRISLNFKLVVAPLWVVDYVVIHELAHITHKNHSSRFWKLVEIYTDRRHDARRWLGENQYQADFLAKESELRGGPPSAFSPAPLGAAEPRARSETSL